MNFLTNLTIKSRLQVNAFVIAVALLVLFVLMLTNLSKMSELGHALAKVESLNGHVLMLRRNEKDFLARKDLKYVDTFKSNATILNMAVSDLKVRAESLGIDTKELNTFSRVSKNYIEQFHALAKFQQVIGLHPKDGLYGELRAAVHAVEEILDANQSYKLLTDMLQLRRAEKDFMLRRDAKYVEKFQSQMNAFYQDIDQAGLDSGTVSQIKSSLSTYNTKFIALTEAEIKIGLDSKSGLLGELRATIHQTEESLTALKSNLENNLENGIASASIIAIGVFIFAIVVVMVIVYQTSKSIINPIVAVRNAISHIRSNKDLTWLVKTKGKDELVELGEDVNTLVRDFKSLISNVNGALHTLDNATEELAKNAQDTLDGMEKQFQESDMVATSGAEMQATVSDIHQNTQLATATANKTDELATNGSNEVALTSKNINELANQLQEALSQIEKLEKDSQSIGTVSDAIRGIAEQTNLLALNAAIEAARAGEQGRGFAVVADEVRSLAMRTQESTSEIETIINSLQSSTQTIVSVVTQCHKYGIECSEQAARAGESLKLISSHVQEVVDMNNQISNSLQEQDHVATEMSKHVIQIRDIAESSQMSAATNAEASQDIAKQAAILHEEIEQYKVS